MNRKNVPIYRRGRRRCGTIRASLLLLKRYQDGHTLNNGQRAMAKLMESRLTKREREYLSYYYEGGMTHRQIARYMNCCPSTVSKGVVRAERKFWAFADILEETGMLEE